MLTMVRSFVGGRALGLRMMRLKKNVRKRDTQFNPNTGKFHCPTCNNGYGRRDTMLGHFRYECGKEPRYRCPYCTLRSKKTSNIYQHVRAMHPKQQVTLVKLYWAWVFRIAGQLEEDTWACRWKLLLEAAARGCRCPTAPFAVSQGTLISWKVKISIQNRDGWRFGGTTWCLRHRNRSCPNVLSVLKFRCNKDWEQLTEKEPLAGTHRHVHWEKNISKE